MARVPAGPAAAPFRPLLLLAVALAPGALGYDNGVGLTPQMGWNSWNLFACRVNETIVRAAAKAMISSGMASAGYEYVNIDDCWQAMEREADGSLTWDTDRFPSGMPALAKHIHSLGLKFGIYSARCRQSCQKRPGSYGHYVQDAKTFASWDVDYLKFDNCWECPPWADPVTEFAQMGAALNATGRRIFYSNELINNGEYVRQGFQMCNSARIGHDIQAKWSSMISEVDIDTPLSPWAGPGFWNDADMLEVGNGMTYQEDRTHFAFWCMLASPLLAGNDLANMDPKTKGILTNRGLISVSQDKLGFQATICASLTADQTSPWQVWTKPLYNGSVAIMAVNRGDDGVAQDLNITFNVMDCLPQGVAPARINDIWTGSYIGTWDGSSPTWTTPMIPLHSHEAYFFTPTDPAKRLNTKSIAQDTPVRLWCPMDMSIAGATVTLWGTTSGSGPFKPCNDAQAATKIVAGMCNGQPSCSVYTGAPTLPMTCSQKSGWEMHFAAEWHCE